MNILPRRFLMITTRLNQPKSSRRDGTIYVSRSESSNSGFPERANNKIGFSDPRGTYVACDSKGEFSEGGQARRFWGVAARSKTPSGQFRSFHVTYQLEIDGDSLQQRRACSTLIISPVGLISAREYYYREYYYSPSVITLPRYNGTVELIELSYYRVTIAFRKFNRYAM